MSYKVSVADLCYLALDIKGIKRTPFASLRILDLEKTLDGVPLDEAKKVIVKWINSLPLKINSSKFTVEIDESKCRWASS